MSEYENKMSPKITRAIAIAVNLMDEWQTSSRYFWHDIFI